MLARKRFTKEDRADLVLSYTKSLQKTSTKDLTFTQANHLIVSIGGTPSRQTKEVSENTKFGYFDIKNTQHRYLLSLCRQIGWIIFNKKLGYMVADIERLGSWLKTTGYLKKPLKKYESKELPKLVAQFEKLLTNQ